MRNDLESVMRQWANSKAVTLGVDEGTREGGPGQRTLRRDLKQLRARNDRRVRAYLGSLLVVLCVLLVLVFRFGGNPGSLAAVVGACGVSVAGVLVRLNRLWKDLYRIDVVLILVGRVSDDKLVQILLGVIEGREATLGEAAAEKVVPVGGRGQGG